MIIIAHRGNLDGPDTEQENDPNVVDLALSRGFDVEVDIWTVEGELFLGHDRPQYAVELQWLIARQSKLWIHCKNIPALELLSETPLNYFWHESDTATLTSHRWIWAYPGRQPITGSIAVMPELNDDDVTFCRGVCTDFPHRYE